MEISAHGRRWSDVTRIQGEELKDFGRAFEVGTGITLHKPCKQIQKALMFCGLSAWE
jgi:hypothetical protein